MFGDEVICPRKGEKSVHSGRYIRCLYEYIGDSILRLSEAFQQVYEIQKTVKTCIPLLHPHPDMSNAAASDVGKGFGKASCAYCTLLLGSFNSAAAGDNT